MSLRRLVLCVLALFPSAFAQDYAVSPQFESDRPIDRVLARVDATKDRWIGEQDFETINAKLKEAAKHLKEGNAAALPALASRTARFADLKLVELKIVGSNRADPQSATTSISIRVELGGVAEAGGLLSLLGPMETVWQRRTDDWTLSEQNREGHD